MTIGEFQETIRNIYFNKDDARGLDGTFSWFIEEVGELSRAMRNKDLPAMKEEFADVLAWLVSMASICGVDIESAAMEKYSAGCPKCGFSPCACPADRRG
ncbi:MAG: MazG nucleotide pyrophosphohydrolase domain protein [bacterium ADurb.Bin236]|nr:MAG: MazG nucleotide pyrophosphohydrolase domain protein [bacterium ADurb.Bin236]HOY63679.1 MazG nucleotide pyrophosphohydrolase domain-containing protein [bacterium]HPN95906.1 MazG nucleotide pyrophosphohydrolase domain-containing protein [bacterium]